MNAIFRCLAWLDKKHRDRVDRIVDDLSPTRSIVPLPDPVGSVVPKEDR